MPLLLDILLWIVAGIALLSLLSGVLLVWSEITSRLRRRQLWR